MIKRRFIVRALLTCLGFCTLSAPAATLTEWRQQRDQLAQDPSVVRLYSFDQSGENVPNLAGNHAGLLTVVEQEPYYNPSLNSAPFTRAELPRWVAGRWPGKAALSLGRADYAVVRSHFYNTGTSALTVEAWVRTHTEPQDKNTSAILAGVARSRSKTINPGRADYRGGWRLVTSSYQGLEFRLERSEADGGVAIVRGGTPLTGHVWHHVAATIDGSNVWLYIDGQNVATQTIPGKFTQPRLPEGEAAHAPEGDIGGLQMGSVLAVSQSTLRFDLDELAIYSRALTDQDIHRHFAIGKPDTPAEQQIAQHRAQLETLAIQDSINLQLPVDTRGYFVRETSTPLTLAVNEKSRLPSGNYRVEWNITDRQDKQIASGRQDVVFASGQPLEQSWPITMPRQCDLYNLNIAFTTSDGKPIVSRALPIGVRLPDGTGSAMRPVYQLAAHEATSRHFESLRLGASCERVIHASSWFPTRKADGSVDFSGLDRRMAILESLGIDMLFCYEPASYTASTPEEMAAGLKFYEESLRLVVAHFKGRIKYYEVGNEPNASSNHTRPDYYVGLLKIARRVIDEIDPQAKIVGPCGVGDFLRWTDSVLAAGGGKYIDILSFHNYLGDSPIRQWRNEMKIEALQAMVKKYMGKSIPIWNSESGFWQPSRIDGRPMTDAEMLAAYQGRTGDSDGIPMARVEGIRMVTEHRSATWQVQSTLLDLSRGVDRYFLLMGPSNFYSMPTASWGLPTEKGLAWAGMAHALVDAKKIALFPISSDRAAAVDITDSAGRRSLVLFADEPSAITLKIPGRTSLEGYDIFGNPVSFAAAGRDIVSITAQDEPIYLLNVPAGMAEVPMMQIRKIPAQIAPQQTLSAELTIENLFDRPLKGTLALQAANCTFKFNADVELAPHEKKTIPFQVTAGALKRGEQLLRANITSGGTILASAQARFVSDGAARPIPKVRQPITLDADDRDWGNIPAETADKISQVMIGRPQVGFTDERAWQGPNDLSFRLRTAWDDQNLYFVIRVRDDDLKAAPAGKESEGYLWDCIELFFDGRPLTQNENSITTGAEQLAIIPALGETAQPCIVHYFGAGKSTLNIQCISKRTADGYIVEGSIRPAAGAPFKLAPGQKIGLSIAVDDGAAKDGERKSQMVLHGNASNSRNTSLWGRYELQGDEK